MVNTVIGLKEHGFDDIVVVNDGSDEAHLGPFNSVAELLEKRTDMEIRSRKDYLANNKKNSG